MEKPAIRRWSTRPTTFCFFYCVSFGYLIQSPGVSEAFNLRKIRRGGFNGQLGLSRVPQNRNLQKSRHIFRSDPLRVQASDVTPPSTPKLNRGKSLSVSAKIDSIVQTALLVCASLVFSVGVIAWEDASTTHPMKSYVSSERFFGSTVRGLAFGLEERERLPIDVEPEQLQKIPSYNEVMLKHRTNRVSTWSNTIMRKDVEDAVRTIQLALLQLEDLKQMAVEYEWEDLAQSIRDPILLTQLDQACDVLNRASEFLSLDARSEIGFDFGSCAWRHCGAFADTREALDELDHLIGILEPFEATFILDVVERSLRDMLAVTTEYQDKSVLVPEYHIFQRKSDMSGDFDSPLDAEYLEALEFIKKLETEES